MRNKSRNIKNLKKFLIISALIILLRFFLPDCIYASSTDQSNYNGAVPSEQKELIEEQINSLDTEVFQDFVSQSEIFKDLNVKNLMTNIGFANMNFNIGNIIKIILTALFKETYSNISIMMKLIVTVLITCLLNNMKQSFGNTNFNDTAFFVCYILIIGIVVQSFNSSAQIASDFIQLTHKFIIFFVPILGTVIAAGGGVISVATLQPLLLGVSQIINFTVTNYLLPLSMLAVAINIISCISEKFSISKFADLIKVIVEWSLKLLLTIFIGAVSIQTMTTSTLDGLSSKTAKFAVSSFIPIIGNILTDSIDLVVGCSKILKNAIGLTGIIVLVIIAVLPIIKLVANVLLFQFTISIIEPIADKRIVNCLSRVAASLSGLIAMVITLEIMFLVSFSIVFCFTNMKT